jgi:hypothetical protein
MNSEKIKIAIQEAKNKALQNKTSTTWLCLVGKETLRYEHIAPVGTILYTLKYENETVTVYDNQEKEVKEVTTTLSQELQSTTAKKVSRSVKQSDKPCGC